MRKTRQTHDTPIYPPYILPMWHSWVRLTRLMAPATTLSQALTRAQAIPTRIPAIWQRDDSQALFRLLDDFAKAVYEIDPTGLADDQYVELERWSQVALHVVELHILLNYSNSDAQPFADLRHRLAEAVNGL